VVHAFLLCGDLQRMIGDDDSEALPSLIFRSRSAAVKSALWNKAITH
jgi:hypothetical protein